MKEALINFLMVLTLGVPDKEINIKINEPISLGLNNFTVVNVVPKDKELAIERKGFNFNHSNFFNIPYETITIKTDNEKYFITNENCGNYELIVNSKLYKFDRLSQIKIGEGVSVEYGGNYNDSVKLK